MGTIRSPVAHPMDTRLCRRRCLPLWVTASERGQSLIDSYAESFPKVCCRNVGPGNGNDDCGSPTGDCYHPPMFNFGRPSTPGQWIAHFLLGIVALFLIYWLIRVYA